MGTRFAMTVRRILPEQHLGDEPKATVAPKTMIKTSLFLSTAKA
jgi:hypothetical protein